MNNLKVKPLTKEQLLISFDRLTRFKHPEVKYLRVFFDVLTNNLISPKYKKTDLEKMDYTQLTDLAQYVFNYSINELGCSSCDDYVINQRLYDYEVSVFSISKNAEKLLKNKIHYKTIIDLINDDSVINLRWLKNLATTIDEKEDRFKYSLKYPIKKVVIAEGATEEILLPEFAKMCGYDFDREGIYMLSAGGKNQVVKLYYKLVDILKIPIFVLLDKDAKENLEEIKPKLRPIDKIHLLRCGEFEDLLPMELVKRTLYYELKNISLLESKMLEEDMPRVKILEEVFKTRGMHEFKKVEFAQMVKKNIKTTSDISAEISDIIREIKLDDIQSNII